MLSRLVPEYKQASACWLAVSEYKQTNLWYLLWTAVPE